MAESVDESHPVESRDQLIEWLSDGSKSVEDWRIGTEHEKFGFHTDDLTPLPYEGPRGVRALLEGLSERFCWQPVMEGENIIALSLPDCMKGGTISLEPGGQFELSGAPLENVNETCNEVHTHLAQVREVGEALGIGFLGVGFSPKWKREETPRMPKNRYKIMSSYMPTVGNLGLDMMYRSCTVQVNLDYSDESDMVKKFRVALALQPIATAIFANSPFKEGKPNGFFSYRSEIWRDTDPDRTGMLPFVFDEGMDFERYAEYALDVPMYFVIRDGEYIDASGQSFRDFLDGRLPALPGECPTISDWSDHLTTLFPEVRLKQFLEMRGADGGPWRRLCALPAFWVGLLYHGSSLDAAWDIVKKWSDEDRQILRDSVPVHALKTEFKNTRLLEIARDVVAISAEGLAARNRVDVCGDSEIQYLSEVQEIVADGRSPAEILLDEYNGDWNGDIDCIFKRHAY